MYKTILVHVDGRPMQESRLRAAAGIALSQGAHLVGCASTGISWLDLSVAAGSAGAPAPILDVDTLRKTSAERLDHFTTQARRLGVESIEVRLEDDLPDASLHLHARYADLVVLSQETEPGPTLPYRLRRLPEHLVLHGPRPVLVVPPAYAAGPVARTVLAAWDGQIPALRALTAALPLLVLADSVKLTLVNPDILSDKHGEEPGADMALYLARHGVAVDVIVERTDMPAGQALLTLANRCGAGLIVAGAYGHSRYREWVLGGTTRDLLAHAKAPLLLAH